LISKDYSDYKVIIEKVAAQENADSFLTEEIKVKVFN
jgi:hypothetical protein